MRPSAPKAERTEQQAQRGLAAQRLVEDEIVIGWFESEHKSLVSEMLNAEIADDSKRRECALQLKTLAKLRKHLETEAAIGRNALKQMENKNV